MNNPLLDLVASVASLNPAAGEIGAGTLANLQSAAQAILDTKLDPRLMPRPLPGRRFVGAFTLPCDATPLANLVGAFARAYPESTLGATVSPWAFVSAPVENGKGGAAEPGGMGQRGEAPDFFSGRPGPAPTGAETAQIGGDGRQTAAKPTLGTVAMTVVPGTLDAFDGQRRRLTFELAEMPAGCELGQTWGIVLPDPVAGHAVPCQEAPFMGWKRDQAFDRRFESRGDRFDGLAYRHTSGEFRWTITQRPPALDVPIPEAVEIQDARFAAWYADCAGIFSNQTQARHFFDQAQP